MDDAQGFVASPTDTSQSGAIAGRETSRRHNKHIILHLPQLALALVLIAIVAGTSMQLAANHGSSATSAVGQAITGGSMSTDAVFTVDQVRAGLLQDPSSWIGRTIRVYGVLQGPFVFCGDVNPCPPATLGLVDDGNGIIGADQYLPVMPESANAVQHLQYNVPLIYRLRLHAAPAACALNPSISCYQGVFKGTTAGDS